MSDKPSNFELDDELLSAYLDGELSANERATVEARLATDPAAQQLLHELRSVSQSVQSLPTESLGRDLSDEIIRRARATAPLSAMASSAKPAPTPDSLRFIEAMPKIRAFNSKRAWIWASMALAAGLLIMFVQRGEEAAKKLPPIAARNQDEAQLQPADEGAQPARRELSMSAAPKSPSASPTTVATDRELREKKVDAFGAAPPAAPMAGEPRGVQLGTPNEVGLAAGPPAAPSAAPTMRKEVEKATTELDDTSGAFTAPLNQVAADKSKVAPQPTGRLGGPGGAPGMHAEKPKSESVVSPTAQRLFVVHVVATPGALEKGSFDRLLADNKIEFVPEPAKNRSFSFGGGKPAKPGPGASEPKDQSNKTAEIQASKTEMVLVEAPAPAIEACLADLNKNADDFVSIAVNEERQSQDRVDAKSTVSKSLADTQKNLSRFSRGAAPVAQNDTIDLRKYFYSYDFDKANEPIANGSSRAAGSGGEAAKTSDAPQDANGNEKLAYKKQVAQDIRRARRIETWGIDNRQAGKATAAAGPAAPALSTQSGPGAKNQPMSQRKPNEQPAAQAEAEAEAQDNNLKVLFVFTPQEAPVPGAPSDNRPK